ncbi:hypothetical protein G7047_23945 [Diaphorobacter sp. HDW4A]|uniref:hypothetical protein n=1 Tax=Diaphorobacter sp. HDW4A TaxID=2714924 RepID=UPI0014083F38|nr:hypothetical protein [Diaphorobacter sp. HDW4A]QIL82644.1 hypothetical protein G7047_23945 [Diaphorobacter sp. HDW4A]
MADAFQPVTRIRCPDGEFIVDARPFELNEGGSSRVDIRYQFRGITLDALQYELYYKNLDSYLLRGQPAIYHLGLKLDTSGGSKKYGPDRGDTLYLQPSRFPAAQAERLATCLTARQTQIRQDMERTKIHGSILLGLMKTRAQLGVTGIARIVAADAPLLGVYGTGGNMILVERNGRVLLHSNSTVNNPAHAVQWGEVVAGTSVHPTLRLHRSIRLEESKYDGQHLLMEKDRRGHRLKEDFEVQWQ